MQGMENTKEHINFIFKENGMNEVRTWGSSFADGTQFLALFNIIHN